MGHGTSGQDGAYEPLSRAEQNKRVKEAKALLRTARANVDEALRGVRLAELAEQRARHSYDEACAALPRRRIVK